MKFFGVVFVWGLIALPIGIGMVLAVKGSPLLLLLSLAAFIFVFARYGCIQH